MSIIDEAYQAVEDHFASRVDCQNISRLSRLANADLFSGPIDGSDDWPGFTVAVDTIAAWCDEELNEVWYDTQSGEVREYEPVGFSEACIECDGDSTSCLICKGTGEEWFEPIWEDYIHFDIAWVKKVIFGNELAGHL